jgi:hypothetical protein
MRSKTKETPRAKAESAWRIAANCAALAHEADGQEEREYYVRMRDAWIGLANRCELFDPPDSGRQSRLGSRPPVRRPSLVQSTSR